MVTVTDGGLWCARALTNGFPVADSEEWRQIMPGPQRGAGFQYRGIFQGGRVYEPGDVVTGAEGAAWITAEGGLSNECPGDVWQLFVKQGERGRGRPGATICNVIADGNVLTFHMTDGRAFSVEWGAAP